MNPPVAQPPATVISRRDGDNLRRAGGFVSKTFLINELDDLKEELHDQIKATFKMELQAARQDIAKQTKAGLQDEAMRIGEKVTKEISGIFKAGIEEVVSKIGALEAKVDEVYQRLNDMADKGASEDKSNAKKPNLPLMSSKDTEEGLAARLDKIQLNTANEEGSDQQKSLARGQAAPAAVARLGEQASIGHTTSSLPSSLDNEQGASPKVTAMTSSAQHAGLSRPGKNEEDDAGAPTRERARTEEGHGHDDDEAGQ